ncbi:DUF397 domain-containing protein [Streptomyces sp. NPDC087844]|uniref:DUF397 domain-containing protein n=1 Tax=Streptomyces sp. NPDC087844 TaxID=3365805 RepID=UPI0037FD5030
MTTSETTWFKSSYSGGGGDNCVEVAVHTATVHVRDSKDIRKQSLAVSPDTWTAFVAAFPSCVGQISSR